MLNLITVFNTINTYAPLSVGVDAPMLPQKLQTDDAVQNRIYHRLSCAFWHRQNQTNLKV